MSFFEPITGADFNEKLEKARSIPGAMIVDVRGDGEFAAGHVPGATHIPMNTIAGLDVPRDTPIFLYCLSGARSQRCAKALTEKMGYTNVTNLGGIVDYKGEKEM